jgi:hypothetical protein
MPNAFADWRYVFEGQPVARIERQRNPGQVSKPTPDFVSLNPGHARFVIARLDRGSSS